MILLFCYIAILTYLYLKVMIWIWNVPHGLMGWTLSCWLMILPAQVVNILENSAQLEEVEGSCLWRLQLAVVSSLSLWFFFFFFHSIGWATAAPQAPTASLNENMAEAQPRCNECKQPWTTTSESKQILPNHFLRYFNQWGKNS